MKLNGRDIRTIKGALSLSGYQLSGVLGSGRFGTCYSVSRHEENFALKVFNKNDVKRRKTKIAREGKILAAIDHCAIPKMIQVIDADGIYGLIMEKKPGNSLEELINWDYDFSENEILSITTQLIAIMEYLYSLKISHRDVKHSNILWDHGKIFLIDFGSARMLSEQKRRFNADFWGIGDVFLRLALTSQEMALDGGDFSVDGLDLDDKQKNVIKRLLYIKQPYESMYAVKQDFKKVFNLD